MREHEGTWGSQREGTRRAPVSKMMHTHEFSTSADSTLIVTISGTYTHTQHTHILHTHISCTLTFTHIQMYHAEIHYTHSHQNQVVHKHPPPLPNHPHQSSDLGHSPASLLLCGGVRKRAGEDVDT